MFKLRTTTGRNIAFTFQADPNFIGQLRNHDIRGTYACLIEVDGTGYSDVSMCSANDKWDREKGRKLALAKAMQIAPLTKEERHQVWLRYQSRNVTNKEWFGETI